MEDSLGTLINTLKILTGYTDWVKEDEGIPDNTDIVLVKTHSMKYNNKVLYNTKTKLSTSLFDAYIVDRKFIYASLYKSEFNIDKQGGIIYKYDINTLDLIETIQLRERYNARLIDRHILLYKGTDYSISNAYYDLKYNYIVPGLIITNIMTISLDTYGIIGDTNGGAMSIIDLDTHTVKKHISCSKSRILWSSKEPKQIKFVGKLLATDILDLEELKAYKCSVPERYRLTTSKIAEIAKKCLDEQCNDEDSSDETLKLALRQYDALITYLLYLDASYKSDDKSTSGFYVEDETTRVNFYRFTDNYCNVMLCSLDNSLVDKYKMEDLLISLSDIIASYMRRSNSMTPFLRRLLNEITKIGKTTEKIVATTIESDSELLKKIINCLRDKESEEEAKECVIKE